jgi:large subunit ribosomal protein L24
MHVRKEDQVLVISGDYRGKKGRVLKVFPEINRIIVEGVNLIKRHTRPTQKNPQGGIVEKEASVHASNVMVICPKCNSVTKVGMRVIEDESTGKASRVRVCKQCGEMLVKAA